MNPNIKQLLVDITDVTERSTEPWTNLVFGTMSRIMMETYDDDMRMFQAWQLLETLLEDVTDDDVYPELARQCQKTLVRRWDQHLSHLEHAADLMIDSDEVEDDDAV